MADQKNSNKLVRELKWLDGKEPDPSIINIQELRSRNINEELHAASIRPLPPGPVHVQNTVQTLDNKYLLLPPPINQSTPAPVTAISPRSSSDLDRDQGEAVDETLRKVAQMLSQPLLTTIGSTPNSNIGSNNDPYDKIMDRQPASTLDTNDNQGQSLPPQKDSYNADPIDQIGNKPNRNFERTRQVIMGINALSHTPELHNKILQELNCNGLCQYSKSC